MARLLSSPMDDSILLISIFWVDSGISSLRMELINFCWERWHTTLLMAEKSVIIRKESMEDAYAIFLSLLNCFRQGISIKIWSISWCFLSSPSWWRCFSRKDIKNCWYFKYISLKNNDLVKIISNFACGFRSSLFLFPFASDWNFMTLYLRNVVPFASKKMFSSNNH